jgi:hypothetical protein
VCVGGVGLRLCKKSSKYSSNADVILQASNVPAWLVGLRYPCLQWLKNMSISDDRKIGNVVVDRDDVKANDRLVEAYLERQYQKQQSSRSLDIFQYIVGLRILTAFTTNTFFQPDEYLQSLEPAWHTVFGENSGAWTTWVPLLPLTWTCSY